MASLWFIFLVFINSYPPIVTLLTVPLKETLLPRSEQSYVNFMSTHHSSFVSMSFHVIKEI